MLIELDAVDAGYDSCGYGSSAEVFYEIKCNNYERIVYKKLECQYE